MVDWKAGEEGDEEEGEEENGEQSEDDAGLVAGGPALQAVPS